MLRSGATSFYHIDGNDSVTSLSNTAGALAQNYTYDSFGNLTASSGLLTNPFRYTAREFDTETNLQYSRARYYNPGAGRFISEDPIRFDGDGENFYAYVSNNPVNFVDPSGLSAELICERIPILRGGWKNAFNLLISRARHCFIHVKCIGGYDVTIELYGPQEDPKHGSPHMNPFNPNRGGTHFPITSPSGYKCCQLEVNLLNAFQKESGNLPIYNGYPGPNSNTFAFKVISEAGGALQFPHNAPGVDYLPFSCSPPPPVLTPHY